MPYYAPKTLYQRLLDVAKDQHNFIGRKARRSMMQQYGHRAIADFEARLAGVGPGDTCLDLGANLGVFTEKLARTGARVHAYEPDPYAFDIASKRVAAYPNVTLHNQAVAFKGGTFTMRRSVKFDRKPAAATGSSTIVFNDPKKFKADGFDVQVVAFRDVLAALGPVAIVKMDIEGAEFDILRDIFAHPGDFDIDALYCETHERSVYAEFAEIDRMRRASETMTRPHVNLYWP
ncbi:MAG: FkbM family methyltransferase [Rhodobacteraceae bacterium]|jgi:FkbM family methyltransferase|nr:FkbM family methyltransferase [Paracoccaceae bacterium]